ncbi:putative leader peptide [Carbonactinospora thermoautotrophica]
MTQHDELLVARLHVDLRRQASSLCRARLSTA